MTLPCGGGGGGGGGNGGGLEDEFDFGTNVGGAPAPPDRMWSGRRTSTLGLGGAGMRGGPPGRLPRVDENATLEGQRGEGRNRGGGGGGGGEGGDAESAPSSRGRTKESV
jgi:hypothetical protein